METLQRAVVWCETVRSVFEYIPELCTESIGESRFSPEKAEKLKGMWISLMQLGCSVDRRYTVNEA